MPAPAAILWIGAVAAAAGSEPEQFLFSQGKDSSAGVVSWVTQSGGASKLYLRAADAAADTVVEGAVGSRYEVVSYLCEMETPNSCSNRSRWLYVSPYMHSVAVSGLTPDTEYRYSTAAAGERRVLRTAPMRGSKGVRVAVVGDCGQTNHSEATLAGMERLGAAAVFWVGDMSYADGEADRWDSWGRMWGGYLSTTPTMVLPGNHEIEQDPTSKETFAHYRARFHMPGSRPEQAAPGVVHSWHDYNFSLKYDYGSSYYSFDVGPVHFVALNTYVPSKRGSVQYEWLRADLDAVDRAVTPWVVVGMHGPMYNSNQKHRGEVATEEMKAAVEPVMVAYGVSLVLAGHVHSYERTLPVSMGRRVEAGEGPVYIVAGDGGNREKLYDKFVEPAPDWAGFRNGTSYGYGSLEVVDGAMKWEWWPVGYSAPEDTADIPIRHYNAALVAMLDAGPTADDDSDSSTAAAVSAAVVALAAVAAAGALLAVRLRQEGTRHRLPRDETHHKDSFELGV